MRITDLSRTKRGRYAVSVEGQYLFSLHEEVFYTARLAVGMDLSVEELEALRRESDYKTAKERALRLLSARGYTAHQLKEKLSRYADEEASQAAVDRMEELGLVNDGDYAFCCARDLYNLKHYSPRRIEQELQRRGIPQDIWREAAAQFAEEETQSQLEGVIRRKYLRYLGEEKGWNKTVGALSRLGYSYDQIKSAIRRVMEEEEAD